MSFGTFSSQACAYARPASHSCDHGYEEQQLEFCFLPDFLNLADGAEPQPFGDCSHDPEIIALLKKIPRRYADEVKQMLEFMSTTNPRTIIKTRRQLTG